MKNNNQIYMIIESLHDRMRECSKEACNADRRAYHHDMMRMEARRLLELLGTGTSEQEIRENLRSLAKTAASVLDAFNFEHYKNKKRSSK